jgi:AcrR family transcriptional regulator
MAGTNDLGRETRARLIRAATDVFAEEGYEGARVQDIAHRAGFTTGAIYANFNGKAGLLAAVIAEEGFSFLSSMSELAAGSSTFDVLRALAADTQSSRPSAKQRILADACAVATRDDAVRGALTPLLGQVKAAIEALIVQAQADGVIDPALPQAPLVHMSLTLMLGGIFARAIELDQPDPVTATTVMTRFVAGFAPGVLDGSQAASPATVRLASVPLLGGDEEALEPLSG